MKTEKEQHQDAPHFVDPGTMLRRQREKLGLSKREVADKLRLREAVIDQIESSQFEPQQVATFTRGYLRSYAKLVGIDEDVVLDAIDHAGNMEHQEQEMQSFSRKTKVAKDNSRIMLLTWGIFLVIIGISSIWWWQNQKDNSLAQGVMHDTNTSEETVALAADELDLTVDSIATVTPDTSASRAEVTESSLTPEVDTATIEDSSLTVSHEAASESQTEQSNDPATPFESVTTANTATDNDVQVAQEPEKPVVKLQDKNRIPLTMAFESDCWVQVKDSNGKTLISELRKSGQKLELQGKAPFKVVLGAPEGVRMTFASEPVDLSGYTAGKVARFTLSL